LNSIIRSKNRFKVVILFLYLWVTRISRSMKLKPRVKSRRPTLCWDRINISCFYALKSKLNRLQDRKIYIRYRSCDSIPLPNLIIKKRSISLRLLKCCTRWRLVWNFEKNTVPLKTEVQCWNGNDKHSRLMQMQERQIVINFQ
jgi:hypothetical protein